jgi:hypothetical protein
MSNAATLLELEHRMLAVCQSGLSAHIYKAVLPLQRLLDTADECLNVGTMSGPAHLSNPNPQMSIVKVCFVHEMTEFGLPVLLCGLFRSCPDFSSPFLVISFLETIYPLVAPWFLWTVLLPEVSQCGFDQNDPRFAAASAIPFTRLLMNMFTQFTGSWVTFHIDVVLALILNEKSKVAALKEIERIVEAPMVERVVLERFARDLDLILALMSEEDLPVVRKLVACLVSHHMLQPAELIAAVSDPELLFRCFSFVRESIDKVTIDQMLNKDEMTLEKASFLVHVFVLKRTDFFEDREAVLANCFQFWSPDFRDLLAGRIVIPEFRQLLINAMGWSNIPGADFCFLLDLAKIRQEEVEALDLVNRSFFLVNALQFIAFSEI